MRAFPWDETPLGPIASWSLPLRSIVQTVLLSRIPMVVIWGAEGTLVYNDGYAAVCGARHPAALGAPILSAWPEATAFNAHVLETGLSGATLSFHAQELELWRNGRPERVWLDLEYVPLLGEEGRPEGILATVIDITDKVDAERRQASDIARRKALEQSLRELAETLESRVAERTAERNLLATIVETTDAQVQVLDLDYRWLAINRSCADEYERLFARRPRVGGCLLDLLAHMPEQQAAAKALWSRALGGEAFTALSEFGEPSHNARCFEMKFEVLRDAEGRRIGAFLTGVDVTERTIEQQRLKRAEEQLRQAQKMEAVGQLTGGIAHDFNNLLGAVVGGFDLIRRKPDDPARVRRIAENGLAAAERGAKLTGQLLAFSRIQTVENRPVVVSEIVAGMRDLLARTLGPMIELDFQLDEDRVPVLSDPVQLEMAVLNLAINARDAMAGGGKLVIRTEVGAIVDDPELAAGLYVTLTVEDDGSGMSPEVAARAFDPFFTTKEVGKGTGLGLSQVYGIARQAGGAARIDSAPGRGTAVRLLLPRTEVVAAEEPEPRTEEAFARAQMARILVVDDDRTMRTMLLESLRSLGYEAWEAVNGMDALPLLRETEPDLVIADYAMPGMNGAEFARAAREAGFSAPIIFASGYSDSAAIDVALGVEAVMLRKPFRIDDLGAAVARQLALSRDRGRERAPVPPRLKSRRPPLE